MAGESAGAYARRQREKGERLIRSAELWERGAAGEAETARHLDGLRAHGWVVFHDVRWPGRPRANIDHVAVGPGGVFVIDSKNWAGSITIRDNVLRQNGRRREPAVAGAGEAALAVTGLLGNLPATGVLCFVRDEALTGWARDVMVCSTGTIAEMLRSRPPVLHPTEVPRVAGQLSSWLRPASQTAGPERLTRSLHVPDAWPAAPSRPRKANGRRLLRGLLSMGVSLLVLMAFVGYLLSATTQPAQHDIESTRGELGTTLTVAGSGTRPTLAVTPLTISPTAVPPRAYRPGPRARLVALDLRVHNQGSQLWRPSSVGTSFSMIGTNGERYHPVLLRTGVPGGLRGAALRPGHTVRGRVVFEVPKRARVSEVRMEVGPGVPRSLSWHVAG